MPITFITRPKLVYTYFSHCSCSPRALSHNYLSPFRIPVRISVCVSACLKAGDGWHGEWRESEIEALRVRRVALRDMTSIYKRRFLLRPTALEIFYNDDSTGSKIRRYELTSSVYLKYILSW